MSQMPAAGRRSVVLQRLALLDQRLRLAVEALPESAEREHPLNGVFISVERARQIASETTASTSLATPGLGSGDAEFAAFACGVGLDVVDADLLLVAAAPAIDRRVEQLYAFLNDDATMSAPTIGLALGLVGLDWNDVDARGRLSNDSMLVRSGFVAIQATDRHFLTRSVVVPDRVTDFLLGSDTVVGTGATAAIAIGASGPRIADETTGELAASLSAGARLVHLRDHPTRTASSVATQALTDAGHDVVSIDLTLGDPGHLLGAGVIEARLRAAALVAGPIERLADIRSGLALTAQLLELGHPVIAYGNDAWDPTWSDSVPLVADTPPLGQDERARLWDDLVGTADVDAGTATAAFRLGPAGIGRAVDAANLFALHAGREVTAEDLVAGARAQNGSGLGRLARRIDPDAGWEDLVLPAGPTRSLRELEARVRNRGLVLDSWDMRRGGGRGDGLTAMFAGPSGTGKTLAAEVVARSLGLDLHTVDLATVVDKYIGETEKNLDRIFDEAEQLSTVLFFDEADALFGKRSDVKDARDRYANVEVAYLLQRMERFDGLAVLATNLKLNIDSAFARRLDLVVDFPLPDEAERARLWIHTLGTSLPLAADVDIDFLAQNFNLAGGDIRNCVMTAAYLAAQGATVLLPGEVTMIDLVRSVAREYRKLGRLCLESDFGRWHSMLDEDVDPPTGR